MRRWRGGAGRSASRRQAAWHNVHGCGSFLTSRGTFYRWAQVWPDVCAELVDAPRVLAVGDLHLENFGTWRDIEGRLVWGVNDADEAFTLPYTQDLVRLATSAALAKADGDLDLSVGGICAAIVEGYSESLRRGVPRTVAKLLGRRFDVKLLRAMGWETGNVHLGTAGAAGARDLSTRRSRWLERATRNTTDAVVDDWRQWKRARAKE